MSKFENLLILKDAILNIGEVDCIMPCGINSVYGVKIRFRDGSNVSSAAKFKAVQDHIHALQRKNTACSSCGGSCHSNPKGSS
jgi:hypothetical protein